MIKGKSLHPCDPSPRPDLLEIQIPKPEEVPIADLKSDGQNPNRMTAQQTQSLIESIKRYGFIVPIVTNKDLVIADGEQRWDAAKTLGMKTVLVIRLPVEDVDRRLLRQILNKIRGEHVLNQDALEFRRIIELGREHDLIKFLGMRQAELNSILRIHNLQKENINIIPKIPATTDIKRGDLYQLGPHRLLCGDSTNLSDLQTLLGPAKIDSIVTDPSFGVYKKNWDNLRSRKQSAGASTYTDIDPEKYQEWTENWLSKIPLADLNTIYIWINGRQLLALLQAAKRLDIYCAEILVWAKQSFIMSDMDYYPQHEFCFYGWKGKHKFYSQKDKHGSVFYIRRPITSPDHPTTKPVELIEPELIDGSPPGGLILDPFVGSGTTLMACERNNRSCYAMEIEPFFCQVVLNRWESYTGEKAHKIDRAV